MPKKTKKSAAKVTIDRNAKRSELQTDDTEASNNNCVDSETMMVEDNKEEEKTMVSGHETPTMRSELTEEEERCHRIWDRLCLRSRGQVIEDDDVAPEALRR